MAPTCWWRGGGVLVVAKRLVGLYPLLPVMKWGLTPPEAALEQCDQLILEQVEPGEAQVDAWIAVRLSARTVFPAELVEARVGPVPAAVEAQVGQLADLPLLSAQHRRVVVVESLEVFAQELAAVRLAPG